jgi:hypothetical protein
MTADGRLTTVLVLGATAYLAYRFGYVWPKNLNESLKLKRAVPRRRSFAEFIPKTRRLDGSEHRADAALFLGDQVSKLYDEVIAASAALDAKATTILGFVGGGVSLYALTVETKAPVHGNLTALLVLAALFFLGSLMACLACLYTRFRSGLPEVREQLAVAEVLDDMHTTAARTAAFLFLLKEDRLDDNRPINVYKTMYVELAHFLFAFGAITIVLNYAVLARTPTTPPPDTTGRCVITTKNASVAFECTTKGDSHGP